LADYSVLSSLEMLMANMTKSHEESETPLDFNKGPIDYETALLLDFQTNEYIDIFKKSGAMGEILRRQNDRCDKEYGLDF